MGYGILPPYINSVREFSSNANDQFFGFNIGVYTYYQCVPVIVGGRPMSTWTNAYTIPCIGPIRSQSYVRATGTVQVNFGGTIAGVTIVNGGNGYLLNPVSAVIAPPPGPGVQEVVTSVIVANGKVTGVTLAGIGTGYDPLNPPSVIITPPF